MNFCTICGSDVARLPKVGRAHSRRFTRYGSMHSADITSRRFGIVVDITDNLPQPRIAGLTHAAGYRVPARQPALTMHSRTAGRSPSAIATASLSAGAKSAGCSTVLPTHRDHQPLCVIAA